MKILLLLIVFCGLSSMVSAQNVGIGTNTPSDAKLHVQQAGTSTLGMFTDGTTGISMMSELNRPAIGLNMYYAGGDYKFKGAGFGGLFYYLPNTGSMTYYSSTVTGAAGAAVVFKGIMTLQAGGNVGIGTTSPDLSRLEIVGSGTQLLSTSGADQPGITHNINIGQQPSLGFNLYYANAFRYMSAGYGAHIQYAPSTGILYFNTSQTKGTPGDVVFFNSNSVALDSNGYLGIGTTAPKTKLHVNSSMVIGGSTITPVAGYALSVDGKVICEELKVQNSAAWPDYVFEQDYSMPTLDALKEMVMKQKHLPGMLPAAIIDAENGYLVGDMQKRLLEKLEELYRYVFIMNDENNQLKTEVMKLKAIVQKQTGLQ
jgi:hypothetical protein